MEIKKRIIEIRDFGVYLLDGFIGLFIRASDSNSERRLLLIRTDAIGDFVLWLDVAQTLRAYYPNHHITLVCNAVVAELAEALPYFDEVIPISPPRFRKNLRYRYRTVKRIAAVRYAKVIHFPYSRHGYFLCGEAIVRIVDSPEKIGSAGEPVQNWRWRIGNRFYTKLIPAKSKRIMELERNAEFVRGLGIPNYRATIYRFPDSFFQPVEHAYDYIIFPGAGSPKRQWALSNFAKIAEYLHNEKKWRGIICGGPGEEKLGTELIKQASAPLQNMIGKTSLVELVRIIANAKLLISNETSAIHIAAAVDTPSICILGGGHYLRFMPYPSYLSNKKLPIPVFHQMDCFGCDWQCRYPIKPYTPYPCIENIQIENVLLAINKMIDDKIIVEAGKVNE